jgi:UDP-2,3-diacylglucosamine pyrophosphatase LpxH
MNTVVLSDIHAGPGLGPWEWLDDAGAARVVDKLEWLALDGTDRVVLAGDVWDRWQCPHDMRPLTMSELLATGPAARVARALEALAAKVATYYVRGNHDDAMTAALLPAGVLWAGDAYIASASASGLELIAEHGHLGSLFCAPDLAAPDGLAMGYFVSRLCATADRDSGSHGPTRHQIVDNLVRMGEGRETLPQALLSAVAARAKVELDDAILMPEDLWGGGETTLRRVLEVYRDVSKRIEAQHGWYYAGTALLAECGHLEPCAEGWFDVGARAVVLGHTHKAVQLAAFGRTYVNSGAWACHCEPSWAEYDSTRLALCGLGPSELGHAAEVQSRA